MHRFICRQVAVSLILVGMLSITSSCGGNAGNERGYESESDSGNAQAADRQNRQPVDLTQLSCEQLQFLADKYESIAESAERAASGDTPAAQASYATAIQARNYVAKIYGIRANKGC